MRGEEAPSDYLCIWAYVSMSMILIEEREKFQFNEWTAQSEREAASRC